MSMVGADRNRDACICFAFRAFLVGLFLVGLIQPRPGFAQSESKLAIMPIEKSTDRIKDEVIESGQTYLRNGLGAFSQFILVTEERQNERLKKLIEQKKEKSYEECYEKECQIPLGQQLAADTILRAEISHFGSCVFSVELIDLAKEASVFAAQESFGCKTSGFREAIDKVLEQIEQHYSDDSPSAKQASAAQTSSKPNKAQEATNSSSRETRAQSQVRRESRRESEQEIPPGQFVAGGLVGTFVGFGLGHAVSEEWGSFGWFYTFGELTTLTLAIVTGSNENATAAGASILGFFTLRLFEMVDIWVRPNVGSGNKSHSPSEAHMPDNAARTELPSSSSSDFIGLEFGFRF